MEARRVTQRDIANLAGVHRATVSLALKNHPSIPETTKRRIRQIAKKIGYRPDPYLSALSAYRCRTQPHAFQGTLAWLVNNVEGYDWEKISVYRSFFEGAKKRAPQYGYNLDIVPLHFPGRTANRLSGILRARNISALLLCPQPGINTEVSFPWEHYSCVTLGYSLAKPQFHTVATSQYKAALMTMRELKKLGYQRIGFVFSANYNERSDFNSLAGFLVESFDLRSSMLHARMLTAGYQDDPGLFLNWFKKNAIDAIVTPHLRIVEILDACGLNAPRDLGVACLSLDTPDGPLSGVYENPLEVGKAAVDFLVPMVQRGERGIPKIPQRLHIQGTWIPGKTVRKQTLK